MGRRVEHLKVVWEPGLQHSEGVSATTDSISKQGSKKPPTWVTETTPHTLPFAQPQQGPVVPHMSPFVLRRLTGPARL